MVPPLSRRTFLQVSTTAAAATYVAHALPASAAADQGSVAVNPPLSTFAYSDVRLLDGPMKRQFDELHARFLNLDELRSEEHTSELQSRGHLVCRLLLEKKKKKKKTNT